ncbi:MAG: MinD/ParA family ATP-binding protein [Candidatus Kariarchaeaceae archaeon]|jgi:MinD-like ATPase involved in chromosome partitioning or flagellar assembly
MSHSYKGGPGKSLFSINIANLLVKQFGKRVLLIESDFVMPCFNEIFRDINPDVYLNDYLNQNIHHLVEYIYPNKTTNFGVIFCSELFSGKDSIHGSDQTWFLRKIEQLKTDFKSLNYDYVIFDLSPGFHFFTVNALVMSNFVLLVSRLDAHSLAGTKRLLDKIYVKAVLRTNVDFKLIINQIPHHPKIESLLNKVRTDFEINYKYLGRVHEFFYESETNYNTSVENFVLPKGDPTCIQLNNFLIENLVE